MFDVTNESTGYRRGWDHWVHDGRGPVRAEPLRDLGLERGALSFRLNFAGKASGGRVLYFRGGSTVGSYPWAN